MALCSDEICLNEFHTYLMDPIQNYLGALDGTYIKINVSVAVHPHYHTRKDEIATNVLAVCSPTDEFIFVLPGWEGSATDSRVLKDAIYRPHGLKISTGIDNNDMLPTAQPDNEGDGPNYNVRNNG
ncbi:uncharacterized protein LOC120079121 [Benincasa hispida]|uniref:uncharacterized protein LOC120079121 n=1 Tax=Benincasa hispida TaxID=102211 RepID=UPI0019023862|nr:uncharacterized protein LOC120079121 [Benincasa hispida]